MPLILSESTYKIVPMSSYYSLYKSLEYGDWASMGDYATLAEAQDNADFDADYAELNWQKVSGIYVAKADVDYDGP